MQLNAREQCEPRKLIGLRGPLYEHTDKAYYLQVRTSEGVQLIGSLDPKSSCFHLVYTHHCLYFGSTASNRMPVDPILLSQDQFGIFDPWGTCHVVFNRRN